MGVLRYLSAMIKRYEQKFGKSPIELLSFNLAHGGFITGRAGQHASDKSIDHFRRRELRIARGEEDITRVDLSTASQVDERDFGSFERRCKSCPAY